MINEDTIYLLRECNAGTQMAVYSIGEILENVKDQKLREILISSKNHHEQLGNELQYIYDAANGSSGFEMAYRHVRRKSVLWLDTHVSDVGLNQLHSHGFRKW